MLRIEILAVEAMAELELIPSECAVALRRIEKTPLDHNRIRALEKESRHETVAFLNYVEEIAGDPDARFLHFGMTSSDILDTCFNLQLVAASDILLAGLSGLAKALKRRAYEYKHTPCIGRSHGIHAEPVTFGLKMAQAYAEIQRNFDRMRIARLEVATGAISGATGTFAHLHPRIEEIVCRRLGLKPEPISTQIVPRDRHALFFTTLGVVASSVERIAIEIRNLQRTEIREASERFGTAQRGSSAMPHKRNPILSENVTGLARLVRSAVIPAMENVALWHERDMSHSSVERAIAPDATGLLDYLLFRMTKIIGNLEVYPENMMRNISITNGLIHSQGVMLELLRKGKSRKQAHAIVQRIAENCQDGGPNFKHALMSDPELTALLTSEEIERLFDLKRHLRHVNAIFARVFEER